MRRSRLMQGWAVVLVALVGGCAQTGVAGGASDESGAYLCQGTRVSAAVLERLAQLEDRIELVIGVETPEGDQTCPSNPPTPFRYTGAGIGIMVPIKGHNLAPDNVSRNAMINALRAPAERANALLKATWPALRRVQLDPWRITEITAAALVLLHLQRPVTQ